MTSQTGKQTTTMHILPNTSRSKKNKTKKFGQLIEYNMKNIFLEKSLNVIEELLPERFLKNQN